MALIDEAVQVVRAYVAGDITRTVLEDWLAHQAQAVADEDGDDASALFGEAYALLAEFSYGHRTEPEVRAELSLFLNALQVETRIDQPALLGKSAGLT